MNSLKLINVNIEKDKHYDTVLAFLDKEKPDVICMQEVPEVFLSHFKELGFYTEFAPIFDEVLNGEKHTIGVAIVSKHKFAARPQYYHRSSNDLKILNTDDYAGTYAGVYLFANINIDGGDFNIATTHAPKSPDGKEDDLQTKCLNIALRQLSKEDPHIICGDFNMPRGYNKLYEEFIKQYSDTIPARYTSSLDRSIHRLGNVPNLNAPIFDIYMVDYVFTQPPYIASEVRLEFGISDHAAVIAQISKQTI